MWGTPVVVKVEKITDKQYREECKQIKKQLKKKPCLFQSVLNKELNKGDK